MATKKGNTCTKKAGSATAKRGMNKVNLLDVVNAAEYAEDTLRIAHELVLDGIGGGGGCNVDDLVAISCVLDRVTAQFQKSITLAGKLRKAGATTPSAGKGVTA